MKALRLQNWNPFPVDPKTIDAILLTHAHIDHSGFIPRLVKEGFQGPVFCTAGTLALSRILLPDTGYLQEEEADYLNRKKVSKHHPALPLFSLNDAKRALRQFLAVEFDQNFSPVEGITARFSYAGHILGAATLRLELNGKRIGFSGDLGRLNDPVFHPPKPIHDVDYLLVESTYGDRLHPDTDPKADLLEIIKNTAARGGVVLIPAFAVGRSQTILYFLAQLKKEGKLPDIPIFVNSPMATEATDVFLKLCEQHKLSADQCRDLENVARYVESADESKALNEKPGPMVIISASGMATGGRILHHLKTFAPDPKNSIVWTGFQAAGTRGEAVLNGVREIKIHGRMVPVNAEIHALENLSAHCDYGEILDWLAKGSLSPRRVFVTHGEKGSAEALAIKISERYKWNCVVPEPFATFTLE